MGKIVKEDIYIYIYIEINVNAHPYLLHLAQRMNIEPPSLFRLSNSIGDVVSFEYEYHELLSNYTCRQPPFQTASL